MYTENSNVPNGEANGTLCCLIKIHLQNEMTHNDFVFRRGKEQQLCSVSAMVLAICCHGLRQMRAVLEELLYFVWSVEVPVMHAKK